MLQTIKMHLLVSLNSQNAWQEITHKYDIQIPTSIRIALKILVGGKVPYVAGKKVAGDPAFVTKVKQFMDRHKNLSATESDYVGVVSRQSDHTVLSLCYPLWTHIVFHVFMVQMCGRDMPRPL